MVDDIVQKIVEASDADEDEIRDQIEAKEQEFAGLVSEEGAAHLVARQYGVEVADDADQDLKVESVVPGMNRVNLTAKVVSILDPTTFDRDDGDEGQVQNIVLGDETGTLMMSLWDDQLDLTEKLDEGDTIEIANAYSKEGYRGGAELRIGDSTKIKRVDDDEIGEVKQTQQQEGSGDSHTEVRIDEIMDEGSRYEITGEVVKIYTSSPFYQVCPECSETLREDNDHECPEHGAVEPEYRLALPVILDDGFGNVRCVFFQERARQLLDAEDVEFKGNSRKLQDYAKKAMGKTVRVRGRAQENDFFDAIEILVNEVETPSTGELIQEKIEAIQDE